MKGILLAFICSVCMYTAASSQVRVAIIGGAHQSDVIEESNLPGFEEDKPYYSRRTGVHFGFIADLAISRRFSFQPGIIFTNKGRKYFYSKDSTIIYTRPSRPDSVVNTFYNDIRKQYLNYIDVPFNIVYKQPLGKKVKFILGVGPYLSLFYSGFEKRENIVYNVSYKIEENEDLPVGDGKGKYPILTYGANALAGFEFGRVFLTANYSRGLNDYYNHQNDEVSLKHEVMGATLGIFLGKPIAETKKPKDKDKDGITDEQDNCPEIAGPAITKGCPDKDADGIADREDQCPSVPGVLAYKGCPIPDSDKDGVFDDKDKCPSQPGLARYDGCPVPDTDKDGINDETDKCPGVAGVARYNGCPVPDSDGDEVNDEEDKCPQVKGLKEKNGCPEEVKKEIVEKVNYAAKKIQFKYGKSDLLPSSYTVLDEVAKLLKTDAELKLLIEGHTSTDGTHDANMRLSQARADKVRDYLLSKGVSPQRVEAKGFGPTQPLNSDKTEAQKAQNRRVELKLSY